jgi:hypothetical protein
MQTISLNPNIDIIRKYFFSIYLSEQSFEKYDKIVKLEPYKPYKEKAIKGFYEAVKKIECNIDLDNFNELLNKYSLLNHYDNLLYAGIKFQIGVNARKELLYSQAQEMANQERIRIKELLSLMNYFFKLYNPSTTQIKVIHKKNQKENLLITDVFTIQSFFDWAKNYFIQVYDYPINEKFDMLADNPKRLTLKTINHLLKEKTKNLTQTINKIKNYLQFETHIKSEENNIISNEQCRFIYDYLIELEILKEDCTQSLPEDYLRALLINREKSKSYKSAK